MRTLGNLRFPVGDLLKQNPCIFILLVLIVGKCELIAITDGLSALVGLVSLQVGYGLRILILHKVGLTHNFGNLSHPLL